MIRIRSVPAEVRSTDRNWPQFFVLAIAVGTAVSGGPPHISVREVLPHTALALSRA